jgi:hypothetical protein
MRSKFAFHGVALALAFLAVGCGGSDAGTKDVLSAANEGIDALKSVKDAASAKEANGKLKAAADKMKAASATVKQATEDQKKQYGEIGQQYKTEVERVTKLGPGVAKECAEGLGAFGGGFMAAGMAVSGLAGK